MVDLNEIKRIPIIDVARDVFDFQLVRVSSHAWSIKEHDSIRITPDINLYNRFSKSSGGSVIDFYIDMMREEYNIDVKFGIAVKQLNEYLQNGSLTLGNYSSETKKNAKYDDFNENSVVKLPPKCTNNENVFQYLCQERKINYGTIKKFIDLKLLYQDTCNNIVFVGYHNHNAILGMSINTYTGSKFSIEGSFNEVGILVKNYLNRSENTNLYVFESPIDCMSFIDIKEYDGQSLEKIDLLILNGCLTCSNSLIRTLLTNKNYTNVSLALDNDSKGHLAMDSCIETISAEYEQLNYVKINKETSYLKDWNDDLKQLMNSIEIQQSVENEYLVVNNSLTANSEMEI